MKTNIIFLSLYFLLEVGAFSQSTSYLPPANISDKEASIILFHLSGNYQERLYEVRNYLNHFAAVYDPYGRDKAQHDRCIYHEICSPFYFAHPLKTAFLADYSRVGDNELDYLLFVDDISSLTGHWLNYELESFMGVTYFDSAKVNKALDEWGQMHAKIFTTTFKREVNYVEDYSEYFPFDFYKTDKELLELYFSLPLQNRLPFIAAFFNSEVSRPNIYKIFKADIDGLLGVSTPDFYFNGQYFLNYHLETIKIWEDELQELIMKGSG